jgi:hypothetical protein
MRPVITSVSASTGPLNGMCCASKPALSRNRSAARCDAAPAPAEAKLSEPGFALAVATSSPSVFHGFDVATTSTVGWKPSGTTAVKSLKVS